MKRMLINAQSEELRVAIIKDGLLIDLDIERPEIEQKKSNIYKGKISSIEPSLNAVFVDYGSERHGFLPLKEISREYFNISEDENLKNIDLQKTLRLGQEVVVQIDKEERGTKGAALTTFITLAGSYLVLMPNNPRAGGISRRIEGDDRDHLRDLLNGLELPEGMGVIIRTAGVNRNVDELKWDLNFLLRYWDAIKQAATMKKGHYLIHQESDVIIRAIRDNLRQDTSEIIIDEPKAFERARNYVAQIRPDFVERIKLYEDTLPLFSQFQVERQIEMAYQREVHLPSGGSIVIDHTEALVAIDINSARATKGGNIEETACQTNLEAAEEISRQLRIRDIGGLVVIDFIDMMQNKNQREVENKLRESLELDRARIQIGRISRFGLLEMSRQRLRSSLASSIHVTCPRCDNQGTIRGVESLAHSIVHLVQEQAVKTNNIQIQVQVPIDVATYILNEQRDVIEAIQKETAAKILIVPNQYLESPQYQIKHVPTDQIHKVDSSYKLVKFPKADNNTTSNTKTTKRTVEPAINEFLSKTLPPAPSAKSQTSLIKRIWDMMIGSSSDSAKTTTKKQPSRTTQSRSRTRPQHAKTNNTNNNNNRRRRNPNQTSNNRNQDQSNGQDQNQGQSRNTNNRQQANGNNRNRPARDKDGNTNNTRRRPNGNQQRRRNPQGQNKNTRPEHSQQTDTTQTQAQEHKPVVAAQPTVKQEPTIQPATQAPVPAPTPEVATSKPAAAAPTPKAADKPKPAAKPKPKSTAKPKPAPSNEPAMQQVKTSGTTAPKQKEVKPSVKTSSVSTKPTYSGLSKSGEDSLQIVKTKKDDDKK